MRNVNIKFSVATNTNTYFATSLKAAQSFCKKHDFVIMRDWNITPSAAEKKAAVKCGRGVWGIIDNN